MPSESVTLCFRIAGLRAVPMLVALACVGIAVASGDHLYNPFRLVLVFGLGLGGLMCSMVSARAEAFVGAGQVLLPGNASFTLVRKSDQESE